MATLLSVRELAKAHGGRSLFTNISFAIADNDKIGLIGPNGAGKSTLMKIIAGLEKPDAGEIVVVKGSQIAYVPQTDDFPDDLTIAEVLSDALKTTPLDDSEKSVRLSITLANCQMEARRDELASNQSGGWKKRLSIARALVTEPDLLLLDEPTNHLDLEGVLWLEDLLKNAQHGVFFISHDRYFLDNVARRVTELSAQYKEGFLSTSGGYADFLEARETYLQQQQHRETALSSVARQEIAWLRRGARARTTKAKGRIEDAGELFQELAEVKRRNRDNRTADLAFAASGRGTKELVVLTDVTKSLGGRTLFAHLDFGLERKNRLGIIGANGSGKTTLLKTLTGQAAPDEGTVKVAQNLQVVYFEQAREGLDPKQKLRDALSPNSDIVKFGDQSMHVVGWAKRFLFKADQLDLPVGQLSGGERARVLIARLMLQPADVLILDEPTNDLDIPTLDVLEESLQTFPGALVLVTHDRYLLDRVCTQMLALFEGGDTIFVADTAQWEAYKTLREQTEKRQQKAATAVAKPATKSVAAAAAPAANLPRLTSAERKELDKMEATIYKAEERIVQIEMDMSKPEIARDAAKLAELWDELPRARTEAEALYARWDELEARRT